MSFFDSLDRTKLVERLQIGVADGSLLRLIGKCLHVGVLDGAEYSEPDTGTAQGSVLSPLLGNVYLHYVLDRWFEREVKIQTIADWCRRYRHLPVKAQHAALTRRIRGHFNYFGVSNNYRSLLLFVEEAKRAWYKWLRRRSQQPHLTWERFCELRGRCAYRPGALLRDSTLSRASVALHTGISVDGSLAQPLVNLSRGLS